MNEVAPMTYCGPVGSGLAMQLAGVTVNETADSSSLLAKLKELKETGEAKIIFVDERLALEVREEIAFLNEDALPAIVLLPSPHEPLNLTQQEMNDLVVRAVGSDILNN